MIRKKLTKRVEKEDIYSNYSNFSNSSAILEKERLSLGKLEKKIESYYLLRKISYPQYLAKKAKLELLYLKLCKKHFSLKLRAVKKSEQKQEPIQIKNLRSKYSKNKNVSCKNKLSQTLEKNTLFNKVIRSPPVYFTFVVLIIIVLLGSCYLIVNLSESSNFVATNSALTGGIVNEGVTEGIINNLPENSTRDINEDINKNINVINSYESGNEGEYYGVAAAPTHDTPILNSSAGLNRTNEVLIVNNISSADGDGDEIKNIVNWYLNGSSVLALNMPFEGGSQSGTSGGIMNGANDYSGNGNNGTIYGVSWKNSTGFGGWGGYNFASDIAWYIQVNNSSSLNFDLDNTNGFSVEARFTSLDDVGAEFLLIKGKGLGDNSSYSIVRNPNGFLIFGIKNGTASKSFVSNISINDSQWHHVIFIVNKLNNKFNAYIDNTLVGSTSIAGFGGIVGASEDLYIGRNVAADKPWNGTIDEVRIWNIPLSSTQVAIIYDNVTDSIAAAETTKSDTWDATMTPNDRESDGITKRSNALTIENIPPVHGVPILNSTLGTNLTTENLTVYNISTADGDSDPVKNIFNWYKDGSSVAVLNMPFENVSDSVFNATKDYSGNDNNGSEHGDATWNSTGGYDGFGAYEFDGNGQYIHPAISETFSEISFSAWIKPTSTKTYSNIMGNRLSLINEFVVYSGTRLRLVGAPFTSVFSGVGTIVLNEWQHVAFTYNGSTTKIYINGAEVAEGTGSGTINAAELVIGEGKLANDKCYNGTIDEVLIFNYSLSEEQITALYNNRTDIIVSQETNKNEIWNVTITPNDGTEDGTTSWSNTLTIANSLPTHSIPMLNSSGATNTTYENLTVYNVSTADVDTDAVKNIFNWYRNGSSITIMNMPFEKVNDNVINATKDYSSYDNNGSEHGDVTWNSTGGYDGKGAFEFDGTDDYIDFGVNAMFKFDNFTDFSFATWINTGTLVGGDIIAYSNGAAPAFRFTVHTDGRLRLVAHDGTTTVNSYSTTRVNDSQWHFVVSTFDRDGNMSAYVDGVMEDTDDMSTVGNISSVGDLVIGRFGSADNGYFNGTMDEMMVFNHSLSVQQVTALFENKTDTIVSQETSKNDVWQAEIIPNDGTEDGSNLSSNSLTIVDTSPTQGVPVLNSSSGTNTTSENLTVYNVSTTDADGDTIKNIVNWYKDGSSITILNMPFDGGSNSTWTKDYSEYTNHGSMAGGAVWNPTGGYGGKGAYELDGVDDYISVPDADIFDYEDENFSVSLWTKTTVPSTDTVAARLFGKGRTGANHGYDLYYQASSDKIGWGDVAGGAYKAGINLNDGSWHHIVTTYSKGGTYQIFLDGTELSVSTAGTLDGFNITDTNFTIGCRLPYNIPSHFYNGTVDDFLFFNRTLTSNQVTALYENKTNTIVSQETDKTEIWNATMTPNDGIQDGPTNWSNTLTIINNIPTAPSLVPLTNGSSTTNRTPEFTWNNSVDGDGDPLTYHLLIDDNAAFNNVEVNVSSIAEGTTNTTYAIETELDVDTTYFWKVRANDSNSYGNFSDAYNFTIDSYIAISLLISTVNFGEATPGDSVNTTDGVNQPFWMENQGNVYVNIIINATSYFDSVSFPSSYYQFRIEENESSAFDTGISILNWTNMSDVPQLSVVDLDWHGVKNDFLASLLVEIPYTEEAGEKSSTITFDVD